MDQDQRDYLAFAAPAILADWMDENGKEIAGAWLRAEGIMPPRATRIDGYGSGYGSGDGDGSGYGSGDGDGSGYGSGDGSGDGSGYGYGDGDGSGDGSGYGYGDGSGYGYGDGEIKTLHTNEGIDMPNQGQYIIVRGRDQGCMCGEYSGHCGREVRLKNARQIYSWSGQRLTLADFAIRPGQCRLSGIVPGETVMLEACGMIPATEEVTTFLKSHPSS